MAIAVYGSYKWALGSAGPDMELVPLYCLNMIDHPPDATEVTLDLVRFFFMGISTHNLLRAPPSKPQREAVPAHFILVSPLGLVKLRHITPLPLRFEVGSFDVGGLALVASSSENAMYSRRQLQGVSQHPLQDIIHPFANQARDTGVNASLDESRLQHHRLRCDERCPLLVRYTRREAGQHLRFVFLRRWCRVSLRDRPIP